MALTVVISYNGRTPLDVNNPLDKGDKDDYGERIEIAYGTSGGFMRFMTTEEASDARSDRVGFFPRLHWQPDSKRTYNLTLFCWHQGFIPRGTTNLLVFPEAGKYQIKYTVSFGGAEYAQTTTVTFAEPERDMDRKAWQWLQRQDKNVLEEYGGLDHLLAEPVIRKRVLGRLNELLTRYPESVHAKYVRSLLGH